MSKKLFVSYAWDEEYDEKVINLVNEIHQYEEFEVIFDKWDLELGQELPLFMEEGVGSSDFVLVICSKRYKENADTRRGGSGYEARLMANEIFKNTEQKKFIPILLNEKDKENIPKFLEGRVWIELFYDKESKEYEKRLDDLFANLIGQSRRPEITKKSVAKRLNKSSSKVREEKSLESESIRIVGIKTDEITLPKMDGTRGSALYKVPFLLNTVPSSLWSKIFVRRWNRPRKFTTMHRPGIASVQGNKIFLDGTTIEEVQQVHRDTLILCINDANKEYDEMIAKQKNDEMRKKKQEEEFTNKINSVIKDIDF